MKRRKFVQSFPLAALLPVASPWATIALENFMAANDPTVYELRIYHVMPGKLDDLVARFRDHTDQLFAKHGMKSVAYWTALDEPAKSSRFIYILRHPSRDAATANWKAFQADPEWISVKQKSEADGKLVEQIDSTFLTLTDFSARLL